MRKDLGVGSSEERQRPSFVGTTIVVLLLVLLGMAALATIMNAIGPFAKRLLGESDPAWPDNLPSVGREMWQIAVPMFFCLIVSVFMWTKLPAERKSSILSLNGVDFWREFSRMVAPILLTAGLTSYVLLVIFTLYNYGALTPPASIPIVGKLIVFGVKSLLLVCLSYITLLYLAGGSQSRPVIRGAVTCLLLTIVVGLMSFVADQCYLSLEYFPLYCKVSGGCSGSQHLLFSVTMNVTLAWMTFLPFAFFFSATRKKAK